MTVDVPLLSPNDLVNDVITEHSVVATSLSMSSLSNWKGFFSFRTLLILQLLCMLKFVIHKSLLYISGVEGFQPCSGVILGFTYLIHLVK